MRSGDGQRMKGLLVHELAYELECRTIENDSVGRSHGDRIKVLCVSR
jgi:hypothetical protein